MPRILEDVVKIISSRRFVVCKEVFGNLGHPSVDRIYLLIDPSIQVARYRDIINIGEIF